MIFITRRELDFYAKSNSRRRERDMNLCESINKIYPQKMRLNIIKDLLLCRKK